MLFPTRTPNHLKAEPKPKKKYDYQKNREYQLQYQKTSPNAKAARKRYYEKHKDQWKEYSNGYRLSDNGQLKIFLARLRNTASKEGLPFNISLEDILPLPAMCPVHGIPIELGNGWSDSFPALFRKNPSDGYTKENCIVVSRKAVSSIPTIPAKEFKEICDFMSNYSYQD